MAAPEPAPGGTTLVVLVTGDPFRVGGELARTLRSLTETAPPPDVVCAFDGPVWRTLPLVQCFFNRLPAAAGVDTAEPADHPGALLNLALPHVRTPYLSVLWPGVEYHPAAIDRLAAALDEAPGAAVTFPGVRAGSPACAAAYAGHVNHGHLQAADLVSLAGAVLRADAVRAVGGCDPNPVFQRASGWDLILRLARDHDLAHVPEAAGEPPRWEWDDYPFLRTLPFARDLVHRSLLKSDRYPASDGRPPRLVGLAPADADRVAGWAAARGCELAVEPADRPLRVLVTGGFFEPVHNQLCFFNYFQTPAGARRFDWTTLLDDAVTDRDVAGCDLVIVSRGRGPNVPNVIAACERLGVPTLYMIDDNWLTVADDWPVYRTMFAPGAPDYEVFRDALRRCTATLVYTPVMEGYVAPLARRTYRIDVNIDLPDGLPEPPAAGSFRIGYAGSPRYTDAAFVAAADFVRDRVDAELVFFGREVPAALADLDAAGRLVRRPWASYRAYRDHLRALRPHALLAPLDLSETSRSKCPNKYLEITAAGAVGVYTETEPYVPLVEDGVHGLLVPAADNDDPRAWREAFERLYASPAHRTRMYRAAARVVAERFETRRVYPAFVGMVEDVLRAARWDRLIHTPDRRTARVAAA